MGTDWEAAFIEFHDANPAVYAELEKYCAEITADGHKRIGIDLLFGRLRWESFIRTHGDYYKINSNFSPYYARMLMRRHPEWEGLFEIRKHHARRSSK